MKKGEEGEEVVAIEGATIRQVLEKQEFDLKEMVKDIANIPSVYSIDTASYKIIARKLGYNGFTIVYMTSNRNGEISLDSFSQTPDNIEYFIEHKGMAVDEKMFYDISKEFSKQELLKKIVGK